MFDAESAGRCIEAQTNKGCLTCPICLIVHVCRYLLAVCARSSLDTTKAKLRDAKPKVLSQSSIWPHELTMVLHSPG